MLIQDHFGAGRRLASADYFVEYTGRVIAGRWCGWGRDREHCCADLCL